ncbi:MAG: (d)CMP kinase [Oscillospiraceae bacterium]|nr:(d)CMP kinase [Oscillospiraceae bacterium]
MNQTNEVKSTPTIQRISVAIDGPAGAGKSTIAKRVAAELGYRYVDTGAIYRTVGYHMKLMGIGPKDTDGIRRCIDDVNIKIDYQADGVQHMILNGQDVTDLIRSPEISMMASGVSAHSCVRDYLLEMQRQLARTHNVVMDGRDIGTVVLPKAQVKIYLTASAEIRAERRYKELLAKGEKVRYEDVYTDVVKRDEQDMNRPIAPLKCAEDAVVVDGSHMTIQQVVAEIEAIIRKKAQANG